MMIIKDLTIKTIQDTCKANKSCYTCPFHISNFNVYSYDTKCIFIYETPDGWPMQTDENLDDFDDD